MAGGPAAGFEVGVAEESAGQGLGTGVRGGRAANTGAPDRPVGGAAAGFGFCEEGAWDGAAGFATGDERGRDVRGEKGAGPSCLRVN